MAEVNPLYAVMIALAEADRWLYAREIGRETQLGKRDVNSVLYTHRDVFARTDEDKPRWQLAEQYRKRKAPKPPAKLAGPAYLPAIEIQFTRVESQSAALPRSHSTEMHTCEACEAEFEGVYLSPIPLCSLCSETYEL